MWWLKAMAVWVLISLATTGLIGRFLAGRYFRERTPKDKSLPESGTDRSAWER